MDVAGYVDELEQDGQLLADGAERAGLEAALPTCPGWTVADLLAHIGHVHRWAASHVNGEPKESANAVRHEPPEGADLLQWFRDGHATVVAALRDAPIDLRCWTFLPAESCLEFWARRQAHETAVHRVDAERASGAESPLPPAFAADGIDELLRGFAAHPRRGTNVDPPRTLLVSPTDTDGGWRFRLGPDRVVVLDDPGDADCEVRGAAHDLYLLLWNRRELDGLDVTGDPGALATWRETIRIGWG